jgi:hypothetical protein
MVGLSRHSRREAGRRAVHQAGDVRYCLPDESGVFREELCAVEEEILFRPGDTFPGCGHQHRIYRKQD